MCPVADVPGAEQSQPTGSLSHTPERAGCLILRVRGRLSEEQVVAIRQSAAPTAHRLNMECIVVDEGGDVELRYSQEPLLAALVKQTEAITRLARSNEALVQAMAEAEGMDEGAMPRVDMSGKPIR